MRTLISITIVILSLVAYFNYTDKSDKVVTKETPSEVSDTIIKQHECVDDFCCTEEVEIDDELNLKIFKSKNLKLIKSAEFLGNPYVKSITNKMSFTIFDISTKTHDKKIYVNSDFLVISYRVLSTNESKTLVCDYRTRMCKVYESRFVTGVSDDNKLEGLVYEYDTTRVDGVTYIVDYELNN